MVLHTIGQSYDQMSIIWSIIWVTHMDLSTMHDPFTTKMGLNHVIMDTNHVPIQ